MIRKEPKLQVRVPNLICSRIDLDTADLSLALTAGSGKTHRSEQSVSIFRTSPNQA